MTDKDLGGELHAATTTPTLAPCPFCGEAPTFIPSGWDGKDETGPWVMCETWRCALHKHETELMDWNRRASHPDSARLDWIEAQVRADDASSQVGVGAVTVVRMAAERHRDGRFLPTSWTIGRDTAPVPCDSLREAIDAAAKLVIVAGQS